MNPCAASALVTLFAIAATIAYYAWRAIRKRQLLHRWAAARGVKLLGYEERRIARGPFLFTTGRGEVVFFITVEYCDERIATGWALCGLLSGKVEVTWDKGDQEALGFPVILSLPPKDPPTSG